MTTVSDIKSPGLVAGVGWRALVLLVVATVAGLIFWFGAALPYFMLDQAHLSQVRDASGVDLHSYRCRHRRSVRRSRPNLARLERPAHRRPPPARPGVHGGRPLQLSRRDLPFHAY